MASVSFETVRKVFGKTTALKDIDLLIRDGEFMVLLGPSGCGKTTLLRCLAGLERIDGGTVRIGEREVSDLPPRDRHIAMVFQSYAVFPHMKVYDNIAFGLRMRKKTKTEIEKRVKEGAALLQLEPYLDRYPAQLSGGQRQRVAVARAIVTDAPVLLMDEPLSNLDALLRLHARAELKRLHTDVKRTTVYVTHDQIEALSMGDRIAVMKDGEIVQVDTPDRAVRPPGERVRRLLHRLAADELHEGRPRRTAPRSATVGRSPARPAWTARRCSSASAPRTSASAKGHSVGGSWCPSRWARTRCSR